MNGLSKATGSRVLVAFGILLLFVADQSFAVFTNGPRRSVSQSVLALRSTQQVFLPVVVHPCGPLLFSDEFNTLDLTKWNIVNGNPLVDDGFLELSSAEIQSKLLFETGCLQGAIRSSDWKPHDEFTDSSFGFELWTGTNGQCHYGVVFKGSGQLAVLRPEPDTAGNCFDNPEHQEYVEISNWDIIRPPEGTVGTVYFTLVWSLNTVTLTIRSDSSSQQGHASYSGETIPSIPLAIRLYAHTFDSGVFDKYHIDYIRVYESR